MTDPIAPASREPILIVDDEKNIRRTLRMVLDGEGYQIHEAGTAAEALAVIAKEPVDVILLDVKLGEDNGIELLRTIKARGDDGVGGPAADVPVVMISGHATIEDAVAATRLGAFDFMEKPLDRHRVMVTVANALERRRMWREVNQLRRAVDARFELLGTTPVMADLRRQIAKVAPTRSRVLITGASGTGKELIARAVHRNSAVAGGPFVKVNCAAIPPELIESELFGHERGAFTGAVAKKRGLFEVADGGTIFLDEIGDMTLAAQAKVLRVLQTGEFTRVGGEKSLRTDSRVVAATNRDLEEMVKAGTFREDLYFRLNVVPIRSPDLAERADDVPLLVEAFVAECCQDNGFAVKPIDDVVFDRLKAYDWPGNVRELRNVVERLVIMSDEVIRERDLPPYLGGPRAAVGRQTGPIPAFTLDKYAGKSLREFREEIESEFIRMKLAELNWNISKTAQVLGIERTNLHKKLRALGIHRADDGKDE
ncbi:MAG: sigma-54-dependent Fis family transcriptional regulator [Kofleriaceae bacterium]|jgi:two-component system nitrogen regulation response regulator NtrX|nr:sigma-54-dependent Fis family transcriptional regulator [Kofleriaceae bacterium]MBP9166214.1 sigma-54-dependent Fis family transcriptional regulator [Kofleriaceae bacterium]MBP9857044.1 sigma-54-dependent Fis family transcriptional regulator [Kofleriaceae bacterium]